MRPVLERVPVEIWHHILEEVINVPFLLDVVCPASCASYYQFSALTLDPGLAYEYAEQERLKIEQVCLAWKRFSNSKQFRFMTGSHRLLYTAPEQALRKVIRLQIVLNTNLSSKLCEVAPFSLLRRLDVYLQNLGRLMNDLLPALALLTRIRSLTLRIGRLERSELSLPALTKQLGRLQTLVVVFDGPISWRGKLSMDHLEVFEIHGLDHAGTDQLTSETYHLPRLNHLYVGALRESQHFRDILEYLQAGAGRLLRSLSIRLREEYFGDPVYMPLSFWACCPRLTEFGTDLGLVNFDSVPADSKLRYLVHRSSKFDSSRLLSNIELFLSMMSKNLRYIILAYFFQWGVVQRTADTAALTRIFELCSKSWEGQLLNRELKCIVSPVD